MLEVQDENTLYFESLARANEELRTIGKGICGLRNRDFKRQENGTLKESGLKDKELWLYVKAFEFEVDTSISMASDPQLV